MTVVLTSDEKELIRFLAEKQIEVCLSILQDDCDEDIELYCLRNEIDRKEVNKLITKRYGVFLKLSDNPGNFLQLDEDNRGLLIHAMEHNTPDHLLEARRGIWRRLNIFDRFPFNSN